MLNKFHLFGLLQTPVQPKRALRTASRTGQKLKGEANKITAFCLLPLAFCLLHLPASAAEPPVLRVVKSQENANQWSGITTRLQAVGVNYCVIDLTAIEHAADLGSTGVMFLPNVEMLSPAQAIALESWMSQGGRIIASGPVGNLSSPGVRQLLQSMLGAYWGFTLSTSSHLQTLPTDEERWVRQPGLTGTAHGGAMIPTGIGSQSVARWQSDQSPAVVTTNHSTVLGWRWGVDAASPASLDSAWLRAALSRYTKLSDTATSNGQNCNGTPDTADIATANPSPPPHPPTAPPVAVKPKHTASINQQPLGLELVTGSKPVAMLEAIALKEDLENHINRFESALLTADAMQSVRPRPNPDSVQQIPRLPDSPTAVASTNIGSAVAWLPEPAAQALAAARETVKALPQLVDQHNYAAAQQQWLKATQILWDHYPIDRYLAQPEIRAIWLDRASIVRAGSKQGLGKIFDQLAAAGINTVFFETINAGYPIYPSKVAPQQNPLVQGWDPLAVAVKLAHERQIELHAWVWTFAAGNRKHNALLNLSPDYPGPLLTAHPDWASYDNHGNLFPPGQGKPFLDPANPAVRRYLIQLFDEIVSRYHVDGLQLDYIRYPFQDPSADRTYGYGQAARQQFQQLTGVDPIQISPRQPDLWEKWTEFRTKQIDTFVAEVSQHLRQKRPNLIMSAAVYPLSETERIQKLQQHWEVWARRGDVDLAVPMTYALDTYRFQRLVQAWIMDGQDAGGQTALPILGSALILPGIRLYNLPLSAAVDQIQLLRDSPVSGYALFAVENLSNDLETIFQHTQGGGGKHPDPIPYRQPFQTAAARYVALQQEWNFLLNSQQLWLRGPELSSFKSQAEVLKSALDQLAAEPSVSRLTVARASLTVLQSQFADWMRLQSLEHPYQVKVWENRLFTLEKLLRYGERTVLKIKN